MIKNRNNIDAKLSRAASQHGSKNGFFFLQPSIATLEAITIISTRNTTILSRVVVTVHVELVMICAVLIVEREREENMQGW